MARSDTEDSGEGRVFLAVQRDLEAIAKADEALARSALAAMALELARQLDDQSNSATSKSMCAGQLRDTLQQLRDLTPRKPEKDGLDELGARREARRAGRPASSA